MRKILLIIFILDVTITLVTAAFASDKYIQYDVDKLARKAQARIKDIDKKLAEIKKNEEIQGKLNELDLLYTQAEELYSQGKYKEAKPFYEKIKQYANDPEVKSAARQKQKELRRLKIQKKSEGKSK
ncbi:MAG: hypothetical protein A2Z72_02375 [Omnitrophica bacterium RBG_13_46_9]|nr:MAG: hypothetical protein A2Z72_02375 [Omnitrophica bacterium RBG_13_46_9]